MAAIRYSKQREAIRMYLLSTKSHPTAEAVYNNIKNEHPRISLGTVYRNLNLLEEQGEALTVVTGSIILMVIQDPTIISHVVGAAV